MRSLTFVAPNIFILSASEEEVLRELDSPHSDRGLAVLGGALIDDVLKAVLTWQWLSGKGNKDIQAARDRLIKGGGSILTFSAKIELAYVTGVVGPTVYADLIRLRDLRNDFSHWVQTKDNQRKVVSVTFDLNDFKQRCKHLRLVDKVVVHLNGAPVATGTARDRYKATCMILYAAFMLFARNPSKRNKVIDAVLKL
jgi:hypothetical protein